MRRHLRVSVNCRRWAAWELRPGQGTRAEFPPRCGSRASSWRGARKAIRRSVAPDPLARSASLWSRPRHFRVRFERFQRLAAPFSIPGASGSQGAGFEATRRGAGSLTRSPSKAAARGFELVPSGHARAHFEPFQGLGETFPGETFGRTGRDGSAVRGATMFASLRPFAPLPGRRHREPPQRRREPPTFPGAFDLKI